MNKVVPWLIVPIVLVGALAAFISPKASTALSPCSSSLNTQQSPTDVTMTKLMAGVTYKFRIDPTSSLPSGGTWTCDFGSITQTGDYTPPSFQPPHGMANLTYTASNGDIASLTFLVAPNPALPNSGFPAYIRVPDSYFSATNIEENPVAEYISGPSQAVTDAGRLQDMVTAHPGVPTLKSSEVYPAPPSFSNCVDLITDTVVTDGGVQQKAATVDAVDIVSSVSDSLVVLVPQSMQVAQKPKKCVVWPVNGMSDLVGTNCTGNGMFYVDSTPVRTGPVMIPPPQSGSMAFTAGVEAKLDAAGFASLGGGFTIGVTYTLTRILWEWNDTKKRDVYKCVNGKWKFAGTKSLTRKGIGETTVPPWCAVVDNYPPDGRPGVWLPWVQQP